MRAAHDLQLAAQRLRDGELVCFPTETVYGLGADAANPAAVAKIFALKGRPAEHPLIVHLGTVDHLERWAPNIPESARRLAAAFWPGPLTLILKKAPWVPAAVTGGQETIGLRIPAHPLALELLRAFGSGLAAPSANRFGRVSPTCAEHVRAEFGAETPLLLDGGPCVVGVESTILHLAGTEPVLLRPGRITPSQLTAVLGRRPRAYRAEDQIRAPGLLASHYAPRTPLQVLPPGEIPAFCAAHPELLIALVAPERAVPEHTSSRTSLIAMPREAQAYAQGLYATLRRLDGQGFDLILVAAPPAEEAWTAVTNRLSRAARTCL